MACLHSCDIRATVRSLIATASVEGLTTSTTLVETSHSVSGINCEFQKLSTSRRMGKPNGVLEDTLRHFVDPFQRDRDDMLALVEFDLNNSWRHSIRNTPFMLNYGQNPDYPVVFNLRSLKPNIGLFVGKWFEELSRAKVCLQATQDRMKRFAYKHRSPTTRFSPGDFVRLNVKNFRLPSGLCRKLPPQFVGPFKVPKAVSKVKLAYRLKLPSNLCIYPVYHVSALKACITSLGITHRRRCRS